MSSGLVGFLSGIIVGGSVGLTTAALLFNKARKGQERRVIKAYERGVIDYRRYKLRSKKSDNAPRMGI